MPKIKYNLLALTFLFLFGCIGAFNLARRVISDAEFRLNISEIIALPPSATISGTATACLNETPLPQITFTGLGGDIPYTFVYTVNGGLDQSVTTNGNDSSVSIDVNTNISGDFVYELISVTDNNNDIQLVNGQATITVAEPPNVTFIYADTGCSADTVIFTSSVSGAEPFSYNWSFGDGNFSQDENPEHIFDALGCGFSNYTVELTVTDNSGCTNTFSSQINLQQRPNLSFEDLNAGFGTPFDNCGNNTVDPTYTINVGNTSVSTGCIMSYDVDWGDGNTASNITFPIEHTYSDIGSYFMTFTGNSDSGCDATKTILVRNSSNPVGAIISPGNTIGLCVPVDEIDFAIGSWGLNPPDTVYNIDYGDGTEIQISQDELIAGTVNYDPSNPELSDPFPIPHEYTVSNCPEPNYTITMVIETSCGETILTAGPIIVLEQPVVDFEFNNPGCVNTQIQFTNNSTGGFSSNCLSVGNHLWDFGDGTTSNLQNPSHIYPAPGNYTVTLQESNICGVSIPVQKTICINPQLEANFVLDNNTGCIPFELNATNTTDLSQTCGDDTYLWSIIYISDFCGTVPSWSFTNGTDETSENPSFQFNNAGLYQITMTVTNSCGDDSTTEIIEVKQPPESNLISIPDSCGPTSINPVATISACSPESETIYNWSFPGGIPASSDQLNPGLITYTSVGDYTITFEITTSCGTSTSTEVFSVKEVPEVTNTDINQTICSNTISAEISLESNLVGTTYTWNANNPIGLTDYIPFGDSDLIPAQILQNNTDTDITLTYTVIPENNGCQGPPVNFDIIIESTPVIITQPESNDWCLNEVPDDLNVSFQGSGLPDYQWYENTLNDNISGTPIVGANNATYTPSTASIGTKFYYVIITFPTDQCNETISEPAEITVFPVPFISDSSFIISICSDSNFTYTPDASNGDIVPENTTYIWPMPVVEPVGAISGISEQLTPVSLIEQTLVNTLAIEATATYTITPITGDCIGESFEVVVEVNSPILLDATVANDPCSGTNDATITINGITGGSPPYNVQWSNFGTGDVQSNLSPGIYTITITDAQDCVSEFPFEIEDSQPLTIDSVINQMTCVGENDGQIQLNLQGGIDPISVVWEDDPTAGVERNNLAPGTYSVTITDGRPCIIEEDYVIYDVLPLQISAIVTDALDCENANSGSINVLIEGGTPPFSSVWSNGEVTEDLNNLIPGAYSVEVTDANGCNIEGSWDIYRFEPLVLDVVTQSEIDCDTKSVVQTFVAMASGGVPPFQYTWSSGTTSGINNELMMTDQEGLVTLEVLDAQGCTANFSLNIDFPELGDPDYDISSFGFLNFGVYSIQDPIEFTNTATGDYVSFLWDFGDGSFSAEENPVHTYFNVGSYIVTQSVTYPFGCVYERIYTIDIEKGYKLIMPDAFTPNEDGLNDYFGPQFIGLNSLELNIFDTWGSLIYSESGDDIRGWNGRIKDEAVENGNYYYMFTAKTFYGDIIKKQGVFVFIK